MKKTAAFILAICLLFTGISFAADTTAVSYKVFKPTGAGMSLLVQSGTKQFKYYIVSRGTSFGFDVTGPTKVKVYTRAEFKTGIKEQSYEIQVWEADRLVKGRKVKATPSALLANSQILGLSRSVIFDVPAGQHSYRLWMISDKADKYYIRFYQTQPGAKSSIDNLQPTQFKRQVTLVSGGNMLPYYLVDTTGGVSLNVAGPAQLIIYCRANYDKNMRGKSKFTLGMYESGKEAAQFPGAVKMATKTEFLELGELVPSTLNTYTFNVPVGKHIYQFKKIDSASPNLALRFKTAKSGLGMMP
jgi:hypothetical protein